MAKRKRLTPAVFAQELHADVTPARAPIADIAGAGAANAALEEVTAELEAARRDGRMIVMIPSDQLDTGHLERDRVALDAEDMAVLESSLRARGLQVPLDVVALGPERYGLISGWRRLTALRRIWAGEGRAEPQEVKCLLRAPETASEAYLAMVEENEIRSGLSFYERARIAARATEQGAFADTRAAIKGLFAAAPPAKRSKISAFLGLYAALDDHLRFAAHIPEHLGLALAKMLDADPARAARLRAALKEADAQDAATERQVLERFARPEAAAKPPAAEVVPGVKMDRKPGRLVLSGPGVDQALATALQDWLKAR